MSSAPIRAPVRGDRRAADLRGLRRHRQVGDDLLRPEHAGGSRCAARRNWRSSCDLFLVVGSSLVVYPAAAFPVIAKRNGATLVIVNREPTDLDASADLVGFRERSGTCFEPLLSQV